MSRADQRPSSEAEWQRLWFALRDRQWRSLAIIGIDCADLAADVADRLANVGKLGEGLSVPLLSVQGKSFPSTTEVSALLASSDCPLSLVVGESPVSNPGMLPIVHAVSGVILVVRLGETTIESIRRAVDTIGRDKVLATVSVG